MMDVKNPELLRYLRSELRPARVAVIMGGTLGGSLLLALLISANYGESQLYTHRYWQIVHSAIFVATSVILVLWSLLNSSQAIVSERVQRTFDFWRTTWLSPLTLAVGKLFGAPIGAWLQFATAFPIVVVTGILAGFRLAPIVGSFLIVALCNVAISALALCLSMRSQDSRRATMLMLLLTLGLVPSLSSGSWLSMPGRGPVVSAWTALSPILGLTAWHNGTIVRVWLFGQEVPSLMVTAGLCLVVIAWCLAALVRSIKLEPEQSSLFSPLQVVGVSACVLLFNYAAFLPWGMVVAEHNPRLDEMSTSRITLDSLVASGVIATLLCLYFTVVSTLLSRDSLRHKMRTIDSVQIAARLIAPWLATAFLGLFAAALALTGYRQMFSGDSPQWSGVIAMYLAIAAYAVRDGMFLQWMIAQRVKAPVLKGIVLLGCYYVGSAVICAVTLGPQQMGQMLRWLAPFTGNPAEPSAQPVWLVLMMLIPPLATAALLAAGVFRKMQRVASQVVNPVSA